MIVRIKIIRITTNRKQLISAAIGQILTRKYANTKKYELWV